MLTPHEIERIRRIEEIERKLFEASIILDLRSFLKSEQLMLTN